MRKQSEIDKEIEALKKLRPLIPAMTYFGESNHKAVDAEIKALATDMEESAVYSEWPNDEDERQRSMALNAIEWRDDEGDKPSDGWKPLIKKSV